MKKYIKYIHVVHHSNRITDSTLETVRAVFTAEIRLFFLVCYISFFIPKYLIEELINEEKHKPSFQKRDLLQISYE